MRPARRGHAAGARRGAARLRGRGRARPPRTVAGRTTLTELVRVPARRGAVAGRAGARRPEPAVARPDLADVRGHELGRLAVEVAAAGGHHLLMVGPAGRGQDDARDAPPGPAAAAHPSAGARGHERALRAGRARCLGAGWCASHRSGRPTTARRWSRSSAGAARRCVRASSSLANNGVLFLDELAEFIAPVLDGLRQPLEEGVVRVSRASSNGRVPGQVPARRGDEPVPVRRGRQPGACRCSEAMRHRYIRRVSGPLVDRFDLRVAVMRPSVDELMGTGRGRGLGHGARARRRRAARSPVPGCRDQRRHPRRRGSTTSRRSPAAAAALLRRELEAGRLSGRGLHRVRRVARTLCRPPRRRRGHLRRPRRHRAAAPRRPGRARQRAPRVNGQHDVACAVALADLPMMGPARLRALLAVDALARRGSGGGDRAADDPRVAAACGRDRGSVRALWARAAKRADPAAALSRSRAGRHRSAAARAGPTIPPSSPPIPSRPRCCFAQGDLAHIAAPARVAIVGTRVCTGDRPRDARAARARAHRGRRRGRVGPGARHRRRGAPRRCSGRTASGRRRSASSAAGSTSSTPREHRELWADVAAAGVLLTEAPLGAPPTAWRFPARNRLIAALADLVVVVESHAAGGSMLTVQRGDVRGRPGDGGPGLGAQPRVRGHEPADPDGCCPVRDAHRRARGARAHRSAARRGRAAVRRPQRCDGAVLALFDCRRRAHARARSSRVSGQPLADAPLALDRLEPRAGSTPRWLVRAWQPA